MASPPGPPSHAPSAHATATLLFFSGGRDSTLAALRLHNAGRRVVLVTTTSPRLEGLARVRTRASELGRVLPPDTIWTCVQEHPNLPPTTLPAFQSYCAIRMGRELGISRIAFGYTEYQSHWTEQTPKAVGALELLLSEHSLALELPARTLSSKEQAIQELAQYGFCLNALEQKLTITEPNCALPLDDGIELAQWRRIVDGLLVQDPEIVIHDRCSLSHMTESPANCDNSPSGQISESFDSVGDQA